MIVVTGAAGFIGSNIIHQLNKFGFKNILAVDNLTNGAKFNNLADCQLMDYLDKDDFRKKINFFEMFPEPIEVVFHEGACSVTTEWNGKYMLDNNYQYSKELLHYCAHYRIPFIYASSAATYGDNKVFIESPENELPLNVYGYSKLIFDQYIRQFLPTAKSQIVGLRYFNVYGPREMHKGSMASVAFHLNNQIHEGDSLRLFAGSDGYENGEQRRDFIFVDDIVKVNLWFWQNPQLSGIFNLGTGRSQTFNDVANAIINYYKKGKIEYIPFPEHLKGHYQSFTQADISKLRSAGYLEKFHSVEEGMEKYLKWLDRVIL